MKIATRSLQRFAVTLGLAVCALAAAAQGVVKIGNIEAQTGSLNTYGWMSSQGVRMAVDEINKAG
ncbi:MAG: branched-chain amino acid ABC transporter substrate-binding protein, partial [Caldimonas sp.]